jgi:hypothetical protein
MTRSSVVDGGAPPAALRNILTALLLVLLPAIAWRKVILKSLLEQPQTCEALNLAVTQGNVGAYNRATLALNYQEHGFIRRGLGGTLLEWVDSSPLAACVDQLLVLHLLSAIWLTIPLVLLVRRMMDQDWRRGAWFALLLAASPQLFMAWGGDLGRIDMFIGGCLAWGVLAVLHQRLWVAVGSLLLGFLAHETSILYGVPLLAALHLHRHGRAGLRTMYLPAAVLIGGTFLIAIGNFALTSASSQDIVNSIVRSQAPSKERDFAAYVAVDSAKGLVTSLCRGVGKAATPFYLAWALGLIALYAWLLWVRFKKALVLPYALATVLPFVMLSLVAIDYGRWLSFAILNAWLFTAAMIPAGERQQSRKSIVLRLIVLGGLIAMRPSHVQLPSYFAKTVAERLWSKKATQGKTTEECDPSWRASIGLPANTGYSERPPD